MATVFLAPGPFGAGGQFFDSNGKPLNGGLLNTYAAGTTTPTATYTTSAGTVQNANPIVLGSDGRITAEVWLPAGQAFKFALVDSVSNLIQNYDNLYGLNDPTTINGIGVTGATVSGALIMNLAPINEAQGANIPVASQINLTTATGNYLSLTGTGTITSIQLSQGAYRELVVNTASCAFVSSNTLALVGGSSFTPAVGDILGFRGEAAPIVRQVLYTSASGPIAPATKTQQTNATLNSVYVSPLHQKDHDSAAKAWGLFNSSAVLLGASWNVASVVHNQTGSFTVNFSTNFTDANYAVLATTQEDQNGTTASMKISQIADTAKAVGSVNIRVARVSDGAQVDPVAIAFVCFGRQ